MSLEVTEKLYTVEEFMELPEDGKQYELVKGELIEMPGPSVAHGLVVSNLLYALESYLKTKPVGRVLTQSAFELNPKNAPLPDLAFVLAERLQGIDYTDAFPGAPDIAIEVISRTDYVFKVDDKIDEYLKAGVKLVWVINPNTKVVFIYRPASGFLPQVLGEEGELEGEDVIPGFKLKVSALFD